MKLGLGQINIKWEDKQANKEKCLKFIKEASSKGVEFLLFPEMTLTGFSMNVKHISDINETISWFSKHAEKNNIFIGFGHVEKDYYEYGKNVFTCVDNKGKNICRYEKIHPFSFGEETQYYKNGKEVVDFKIKDFYITPFICYDLRFPEIFQIASIKSQLIVLIANWPKARREHWLTLLKARSIENQCYVAAVNRVGIGNNIKYSGDSVIFDPLGNIINIGHNNEELITAELDINQVNEIRQKFNIKNDRKESLYYNEYKRRSGYNG